MTRLFAILALAIALVGPVTQAEDRVVASLSQHNLALTTDFTGTELFVYGAIRTVGDLPADAIDVIVAITGPTERVNVRKKERQFGIWINGKGVEIDAAPSFYAVATTGPLRDIVSWTEDFRHRIALDLVIRLIDAPAWVEDREEYRAAVARIREEQGLYSLQEGTVALIDNALFETRIQLPANLVEGDYKARIFLLKDGTVLDTYEDRVEVRRAGIGRWIYTSAHEWPAVYGIVSILVALAAGWLASAFFRTFFPN
ncbi:MAG: TIGR02186 family protein [Pseudomonadota bacterium]